MINSKMLKLSAEAISKTLNINANDGRNLVVTALKLKSWEETLEKSTTDQISIHSNLEWSETILSALKINPSTNIIELLKATSPLNPKPKSIGTYILDTNNNNHKSKSTLINELSHLSELGEVDLSDTIKRLSKPQLMNVTSLSQPIDREPYMRFIYGILKWNIKACSEKDWYGNGYLGSIVEVGEQRPIYIYNIVLAPGNKPTRLELDVISHLSSLASDNALNPILLFSNALTNVHNKKLSIIGLQMLKGTWYWLLSNRVTPVHQTCSELKVNFKATLQTKSITMTHKPHNHPDVVTTGNTYTDILHAIVNGDFVEIDNSQGLELMSKQHHHLNDDWFI